MNQSFETPQAERRAQLENFDWAEELARLRRARILGVVDDDWLVGGSYGDAVAAERPGAACRPRQDRGRRLNSSQVADAWISPLTNLQPPSATGGNMYVH